MTDTGRDQDSAKPDGSGAGGSRPDVKTPELPRPNSPRALREAEEDRLRQRQNILAAIFIVGLLAASYWLINAMADAQKLEMCLLAHHRNCAPVDTTLPPQ